jgi:hypothetical protein
MSDELDIIVSKIEKLWRLANHSHTSDVERETFEAKALALMARHRVVMAQLDIERKDPLADYKFGMVAGGYARPLLQILSSVASAYSCRVWWYTKPEGKDVSIFGFKSDAERSISLGKMLMNEALTQASYKTSPNVHARAFRQSYLIGFARAIATRFQEASRIAEQETTPEQSISTALVFVERSKQVDAAYRKRNFTTASRIRLSSMAGFNAGYEDGTNANTSRAPLANKKELTA